VKKNGKNGQKSMASGRNGKLGKDGGTVQKVKAEENVAEENGSRRDSKTNSMNPSAKLSHKLLSKSLKS
jgi:hypothetical protein